MKAAYSLQLVEWICLALALLLVGLYGALALRKLRLNRRARQHQALLDRFARSDSFVERYVSAGVSSRRLRPRSQLQLEALEDFLYQRLGSGGTESEKARVRQLAAMWLEEDYRRLMTKRSVQKRKHVLQMTGRFELSELSPDIRLLVGRTREVDERWLALQVLAELREPEIWSLLLQQSEHRGLADVPDHHLRRVLSAMPIDILEQAATPDLWKQLPSRLQANAVDVLRTRHLRSGPILQLFEELLTHPSEELRIRALKALSNFGYLSPAAEARFLAHIRTSELGWTERMMAARLMGEVPQPEYVRFLEGWMGDGSYLVRLEAGAALTRYPGGYARLQFIESHHEDRYARETAAELLEGRALDDRNG